MQLPNCQRIASIPTTILFIVVCSSLLLPAVSFQSRKLACFRGATNVLDIFGIDKFSIRLLRSSSYDFDNHSFIGETTNFSPLSSKNDDIDEATSSKGRRDLLLSATCSLLGLSAIASPAEAIDIFNRKGLYVLNSRDELAASLLQSVGTQQLEVFPKLSSEYALLRVLPVKNPVFRTIEQNLEALSVLRFRPNATPENIDKAWAKAQISIDTAVSILNSKRVQLEPVFNPDDSTEVAILKAERGEIILGDLSQDLEYLKESIELKVGQGLIGGKNE